MENEIDGDEFEKDGKDLNDENVTQLLISYQAPDENDVCDLIRISVYQ